MKQHIRFKRLISIMLALTLVFAVFAVSVPADAASTPSAATVKKAYSSYLKKQVKKGKLQTGSFYSLYDFNKDGVKELVVTEVGGARGSVTLYTYKNKKVVSLNNEGWNSFGYIKGKKYVVASGSSGAEYSYYTVYKISGSKLKKVAGYSYEEGICKKNGKKISENAFNNFSNKIIYDLGKDYTIK